jgi:hypothetical protein
MVSRARPRGSAVVAQVVAEVAEPDRAYRRLLSFRRDRRSEGAEEEAVAAGTGPLPQPEIHRGKSASGVASSRKPKQRPSLRQ